MHGRSHEKLTKRTDRPIEKGLKGKGDGWPDTYIVISSGGELSETAYAHMLSSARLAMSPSSP